MRRRLCGHRHGAIWVEQVFVIRAESQSNQSARIWYRFALPSLVRLITVQRLLRGRVPLARRLSLQVVLTDQRFLNLSNPLSINRLLATSPSRLLARVMRGMARGLLCLRIRTRGLRLS